MSYKDKLVQSNLSSAKEFKSLDEVAKTEPPKVQWIVWTSRPDYRFYLVLAEARETANRELVLVMYSLAEEMFYVAYAPPRYIQALKQIEPGAWLEIAIDSKGYVERMAFAESELTEQDLQEMLQDFLKELAKAYAMRPRTWQKVYELFAEEVPEPEIISDKPFAKPEDEIPF